MIRTIIAAIASLSFAGVLHSECVATPPDEVSSHVRVHVVLDGEPLRGAKVIFYPVDSHSCTCATDVLRSNPLEISPDYTLITDANGDYSLPELAPGEYEVAATLNGVASTPFFGLHVTRDPKVTVFPMDLTLQVQRLEAAARAYHQVEGFRGTVHDPTGAAIPRASIVVVTSQLKDVVLTGKTDSNGHFSAELAAGSYLAVFFSQGLRPGIVAFDVVKGGSSELSVRLNIGGCP